jgi:addiction module RelE/StbE family toxin
MVRIKHVEKSLRKLPPHLLEKFRKWIKDVENDGLTEVQKVRAWRDHPLSGKRKGQRAICLNGPWRAIYEIKGEEVEFVDVVEVTPHDY